MVVEDGLALDHRRRSCCPTTVFDGPDEHGGAEARAVARGGGEEQTFWLAGPMGNGARALLEAR